MGRKAAQTEGQRSRASKRGGIHSGTLQNRPTRGAPLRVGSELPDGCWPIGHGVQVHSVRHVPTLGFAWGQHPQCQTVPQLGKACGTGGNLWSILRRDLGAGGSTPPARFQPFWLSRRFHRRHVVTDVIQSTVSLRHSTATGLRLCFTKISSACTNIIRSRLSQLT